MAGFREFLTGEVLTAANVNSFLMQQAVMVFADDAARTTALTGVVAEGMLTYNLDTQSLEVFDGTDFVAVGGAVKEKRVDGFTGSGTFTVPAGVTYAIAHMLGGGGGTSNQTNDAANGGVSSVAFAAGTVTAPGGVRGARDIGGGSGTGVAAPANSGQGALAYVLGVSSQAQIRGQDGGFIVAGADVTPAASITVTVGAGGTAGTGGVAGGSGYVYIEYFEEA